MDTFTSSSSSGIGTGGLASKSGHGVKRTGGLHKLLCGTSSGRRKSGEHIESLICVGKARLFQSGRFRKNLTQFQVFVQNKQSRSNKREFFTSCIGVLTGKDRTRGPPTRPHSLPLPDFPALFFLPPLLPPPVSFSNLSPA